MLCTDKHTLPLQWSFLSTATLYPAKRRIWSLLEHLSCLSTGLYTMWKYVKSLVSLFYYMKFSSTNITCDHLCFCQYFRVHPARATQCFHCTTFSGPKQEWVCYIATVSLDILVWFWRICFQGFYEMITPYVHTRSGNDVCTHPMGVFLSVEPEYFFVTTVFGDIVMKFIVLCRQKLHWRDKCNNNRYMTSLRGSIFLLLF